MINNSCVFLCYSRPCSSYFLLLCVLPFLFRLSLLIPLSCLCPLLLCPGPHCCARETKKDPAWKKLSHTKALRSVVAWSSVRAWDRSVNEWGTDRLINWVTATSFPILWICKADVNCEIDLKWNCIQQEDLICVSSNCERPKFRNPMSENIPAVIFLQMRDLNGLAVKTHVQLQFRGAFRNSFCRYRSSGLLLSVLSLSRKYVISLLYGACSHCGR